jgi:hypothetical protein
MIALTSNSLSGFSAKGWRTHFCFGPKGLYYVSD